MLSRVFLAAGVAAMAIAAPASAQKGGHGGGHDKGGQSEQGGGHGNGGERGDRGGRGHGGGFQMPQQRFERQQSHGSERQQARRFEGREHGFERQARNFERQRGFEHQARNFERQHRFDRERGRNFERQQARRFERQGHDFDRQRGFERHQARRFEREARNFEHRRDFERQQARHFDRHGDFERQQARIAQREQMRMNRAQHALADQQRFALEQFRGDRFGEHDFARNWAPAYQRFAYANDRQVVPFTEVTRFVGSPLSALTGFNLSPLPASVQYLYPDTDDYYYRYGDGYLYQVDRGDNLISSLLPLLAGGILPGQYLPASYMNSYVPDYYGFNSFYPDYNDTCNRYYYGVVYQVDCDDGYVENVIPMYAGGYGVGQLLPAAYSTYNVPTQYRSLYYDTPDYGYWYSPGAIYQYDNDSSMITSVAALLSPGFTIGQQLPVGYDVYNVPYQYRQTYYDTPDAWYRYNNGYIYQVNPTTQLVTAIVASLLT